jgi:3-hydroxybutyryl-CoA dehydratase
MTHGRHYADPAPKRFEDFCESDVIVTRGRTIDVGDLTAFAGLTGDHYPLHTDASYCASTSFGERIAHGPLTFSVAVGLVGMSGFYGDAIVALLGIDDLRATRPVRTGDTVHVEAEVVEASIDEQRPRYGLLRVAYRVINQDGEVVMTFLQSMLAHRENLEG